MLSAIIYFNTFIAKNSCRLCYLYLVCNIPFTNSTVYFIKKKLKKLNYKGFVTFISPRTVFGVPLIFINTVISDYLSYKHLSVIQ